MGVSFRAGALALTVLTLSSLSNTALSAYHCNSSPEWSSPKFSPRDCDVAVFDFFRRKVLVHGDSAVEFVRIGTKPRSRLPTVLTPQKYEFGKITRPINPVSRFAIVDISFTKPQPAGSS